MSQLILFEDLEKKDKKLWRGARWAYSRFHTPCENCPLHQRQDQGRVNSFGDFSTARVVLVGEAPGREEVEQGRPFVGRAGRLLRQVLKEVGIKESEVVFTNVCRCRPPGNRTPTKKEIQCCMKYLRSELEGFDGLVVLLGATPLSAFLGRGTISSYRGYGFSLGGKQFFVTYHPSYILRRGTSAIRKLFTDDLRKVRKWLDTEKQVPFVLINSTEELERFLTTLPAEGEFSFDIETTGLSPFAHEAKILSIAFSDGSQSWVLPLEHQDSNFATSSEQIVDKLVHTFREKRIKLMGHNAKFDLLWLRVLYGVDNLNLVFDTMVGNYLLVGNNAPQGLKNLAWYYTDYGGYEVLDTGSLIDYPLEQIAGYNAMDAFVTYLVAEKIRHLLSERQLFLAEKILAPVSQVLVEMEADGLQIHTENLETLLMRRLLKFRRSRRDCIHIPRCNRLRKRLESLSNSTPHSSWLEC